MKIISSPSRARWPPSGRELNVSISPFFPIGSVNLPLRTHLDRLQPFFTLRLISSTIVFGNGARPRLLHSYPESSSTPLLRIPLSFTAFFLIFLLYRPRICFSISTLTPTARPSKNPLRAILYGAPLGNRVRHLVVSSSNAVCITLGSRQPGSSCESTLFATCIPRFPNPVPPKPGPLHDRAKRNAVQPCKNSCSFAAWQNPHRHRA